MAEANGMDSLISAMSDEDLAGLKVKYAGNASVETLIDGILATRVKEAEQVKVKEAFGKDIGKLFAKLPHPEDIFNIYARWGEVDVVDGEPEPVVINGETEMRSPTHKEHQWIVEVNYTHRLTASGTPASPTTSKRAITVFKRDGTMLVEKGHFASASRACEALGLTTGGDSATRVLARDGYITEPYTGAEVTS